MPEKEIFSSAAWLEELNKVVQDYHLFAAQATSLDAKEFMAYHNACKSALAHILILKKLVGSAAQNEAEPDFLGLLQQAKTATQESGENDDSFD